MSTREPEADRLMNAVMKEQRRRGGGCRRSLCDKDEAGLSSIGVEMR
jgi:hypothetical protein